MRTILHGSALEFFLKKTISGDKNKIEVAWQESTVKKQHGTLKEDWK